MLLEYPSISVSKDIHSSLWKICFYKSIEEYRKIFRKLASLINERNEAVANPNFEHHSSTKFLSMSSTKFEEHEKAKHQLVRFNAEFQSFLSEINLFYDDLMKKLFFIMPKANMIADSESHSIASDIRGSIFKCLLYLGDVARYAELHSENRLKNWTIAERYYERAARIMPDSGNPHNQVLFKHFIFLQNNHL
jgi:hypothetical protein